MSGFIYKYETHLHTNVGSACGESSPEEMVASYKAAGYTGIFITDHNWGGNTAISRRLCWTEWVHRFAEGFERAKRAGNACGLQVFFGWEAGDRGTEFLIYGLDKSWLLKHPEIREASIEKQYELVHQSGGMVVHAHPFREEFYIPKILLFPTYVDAIETVNATHSNRNSTAHFNPKYNDLAFAYAKQYGLPMTAGSDLHVADTMLNGGIIFSRKLENDHDFIKAVMGKEKYQLTDGENQYFVN